MLPTLDELRAMQPANRAGYLEQLGFDLADRERSQPRWERQAEQARLDADASARWAQRKADELAERRAYFATLEAAGLWPVATPKEG